MSLLSGMASILRSSKFVRYIAGFARNIVLNTPREFDGNLVNNTQCLCGSSRNFANQMPQHDQNLDYTLKRLDQDVRKSGRISRRDIEDVIEEIRNNRSATSSQSLLVIRCCGNLVPEELPEVRTKLVQEIWSTLNKLNVPMDISHYNALLRVYLENEHEFSPTGFLSELESKGIEPNRVTYQRLILKYCQNGDIEGATKILEFMREKQLPVNENVFNALIVGHSQAGDMDSAYGIIGVMIQANLEPSADTYTTLLCGYAKKGNLPVMEKLMNECQSKEIYLLDKDYLDIIYSLSINNFDVMVPTILERIRKSIGYNQDAINLILRLINKEKDDTAFLILQSMVRRTHEDGQLQATGGFFIKHMIKANRPLKKIIEICDKLEKLNMFERGLVLAAETSLQIGNNKLAFELLDELKRRGIEIRQHYFWPLLLSKANESSNQGIVDVLIKMNNYITPTVRTIRDHVIPYMKGKSTDILASLRDANISLASSASSLVLHLLNKNEIEEASVISSKISSYYNPDLIKRPLTNAFYKTNDLKSYINIVRNVYDNLDRRLLLNENDSKIDKINVIGEFLIDLTVNKQHFKKVIVNCLKDLIDEGLSINTQSAELIQDKLGDNMTEEISNLLSKLTSGNLKPVIRKSQPMYVPSNQMNIPQLERLIANLDAKNQDTKGLKRQLFTLYYREKDLEKVENLLKQLENSNFQITSGIHAQLADLYAYHNNVEKSMYHFNEIKKLENDNFKIDESKILQIAEAFVKNNRFDDAIDLLKVTPVERKDERTFNYSSQVWKFLNYLAELKRVDDLELLFMTLLKQGYIEPTNILLGPLIKVHILNNDLERALEKLEWCVRQYKVTPWKNELACKLIQSEDAEKLQKLTDLGTEVHGEINSLYDLVFSFVECGRVRQARKILETPGLQNRPQRINYACERYQQEGLIKPLESLKDATKDLNHIDRYDIYYQLLLSYIKQDDPDKALGLWTQMQEEDLLPNDQFLSKLGQYLMSKNINVPFVISSLPVQNDTKSQIQIFRQKVKGNDLNGALSIYQTEKNLTVSDLSLLIEKLTQNDRLNEATTVALDILNRNLTPIIRVFRFYLNKLAGAGNVDALKQIGEKINQEIKKNVSYDNKLCHANLIADRAKDYLDNLEDEIDKTNDPNELLKLSEKFPRGGAYGIIERKPDLLEQYENVAIKYVKKDIVAPVNVLWTHYFITKNEEKAEEIWNKYLKNSPRIMFQRIVHAAREKTDENLICRLIDHLKISKVTEGAVGNAYSCLLDVLVTKEKYDDIINTFETAVKEAGLIHINRTAILRVRDVYNKLNVPFNYAIPPKNAKNLISSTSEDDVKISN